MSSWLWLRMCRLLTSRRASRAARRVLPGFNLTLGYTLLYLSLIVLIPLSALNGDMIVDRGERLDGGADGLPVAGAQRGTGGTVTSVGGYTIHTFTSSGTFTA